MKIEDYFSLVDNKIIKERKYREKRLSILKERYSLYHGKGKRKKNKKLLKTS